MRQAGREEFYYTDLNYITFCQISAPQTHLTWYPYIYWLCFSLLSVIAEKFKSVFFFLVKSVGQICFISSSISKIHWRQGLSYKNYSWLVSVFISSIVPDSVTRPISANVLCTHKWKEEKKYCIYNTPHSYIPKSSVCASLCVSASTEIQSLQSTSDLICRARPTHWDDSLEPAPTNSDWQRRNLGCLPRQ